ncbi:MAG: LysM peptidoglycan-binding domain-containing protein [Frankiaceae bacterium]|nr:LysM peptidoglycan-binding domain-containing protein [Frankiaceae bacterium]MBV9872772.1 LysM peptidoglycan-binding domain-containing protein [Frankiaceae bacterium]
MDIHDTSAPPSRLLRALLLMTAAIGGAVLIWHLHPGTSTGSSAPDADIVLAATWLSWAAAGYLCMAVAATAAAHVAAGLGVAGQSLARIAPYRIRRLVDAALSIGVAASLVAGPAAGVAAAAPPPAAARTVAGSALDWPGLVATTAATPYHHHNHHHRAPPRAAGDVVVVQPGDTLWAIAARHLGPGATGTSITAAWHAWYAANRGVIGANPSLIHAGQRLVIPTSTDD